MRRLACLFSAALALCLLGCASESSSPYVVDTPSGPADTRVSPHGKTRPTLPDTTSESDVSYYNPNTGTSSDYELEVDRDSDGNIQRINFPNGGWKEVDSWMVTDNGDGTETVTDERGYEYTVSKPDDFDDGYDDDYDDDDGGDDDW